MGGRLRFLFDRIFRPGRLDRELDEEVGFHIAERARDLQRAGADPRQALRRARIEFGGAEKYKEASRDVRRLRWLHDVLTDLRYGWRVLHKSPAFTAAAVLTLALGIGANTAVFSLVSWLVMRPLNAERPEQLVFLAFPQADRRFDHLFSLDEYRQIRQAGGRIFSDVAGLGFGGSVGESRGGDGLTADGATQPVQPVFVTGNFFSILGIHPQIGRFLLAGEGTTPGADPVVVISDQYWQSRFASDPSIVGKRVKVNGQPTTVVGVAPKDFHGITPIIDMQAYLPLGMSLVEGTAGARWFDDPKARPLVVFARLRDGVTCQQAQDALATLGTHLARGDGRQQARTRLLVLPLRPPGIMSGPSPLPRLAALFLVLAGLVLLVASINVTNLLLVRAGVRQHEMSIRSALGAGRGRMVRQMLSESILLALLGCAAGALVGVACSRLLTGLQFQTEVPLVLDVRFDWRVFAYTLVTSVFTGALVGVVPALRASRGSVAPSLQQRGRIASGSRQRWRRALVVVQVGVSLALLVVAALFTRSLAAVQSQDFGFDARGVLNVKVSPRQIGMTGEQGSEFYRAMMERVDALPGVDAASLASSVPLGDDEVELSVELPGHANASNEKAPTPVYTIVSARYFSTMRMRLLKGRGLEEGDSGDAALVAVINQQMADRLWPGQDPIGRQFMVPGNPRRALHVVGVVNNSRTMDVDGPVTMGFYVPLAQNYTPSVILQVRTRQRPEALLPSILNSIHAIEPTMPVYGIRTMEQAVNGINGLQLYVVGAGLVATMGVIGLLLAVIGVYGIVAYSVDQRRPEIGVRVALGAQPSEILYMMSREGLTTVTVGLAFGLAAAFAVTRLLGGFLTGVSDTDPLTYAAVSCCLGLTAMLAVYVPARRAMRLDPIAALRCE